MAASFSSLIEFREFVAQMPVADAAASNAAQDRNMQLTKPPGALGRLEDLAIWVAAWQGRERPAIQSPQVVIFAGNHGVAAEGVVAGSGAGLGAFVAARLGAGTPVGPGVPLFLCGL